MSLFLKVFLKFILMYFIQHSFICRSSESTVRRMLGLNPRLLRLFMALAFRRFNHLAISHSHSHTHISHKKKCISDIMGKNCRINPHGIQIVRTNRDTYIKASEEWYKLARYFCLEKKNPPLNYWYDCLLLYIKILLRLTILPYRLKRKKCNALSMGSFMWLIFNVVNSP